MIRNLLKPDWEQKDPQKRLRAVGKLELDIPQHLTVLTNLADTDPEEDVRISALARLSDPQWLAASSERGNTLARGRLLELVVSGDTDESILLGFCEVTTSPWLIEFVCLCPHQKVRQAALMRLDQLNDIARVASQSHFADTRDLAASQIEDFDVLQQVWRDVREKDKTLAKKLRERIDEHRQEQEQLQALRAKARQLADSMVELSTTPWSPQYSARFSALVSQWQQIEMQISEVDKAAYRNAAIVAEAVVASHRVVAEAMELQSKILQEAKDLASEASQLDWSQAEQLRQALNAIQRRWLDSLAVVESSADQNSEFESAVNFLSWMLRLLDASTFLKADLGTMGSSTDALDSQVDPQVDPQADGQLDAQNVRSDEEVGTGVFDADKLAALERLLSELQAPPTSKSVAIWSSLNALCKKLQAQKDTQKAELRQKIESIEKQIARVKRAAASGDFAQAKGVRAKLEARIANFPDSHRSRLEEKLVEAEAAIDSMADWQDFAVQPKFVELCESMDALLTKKMEPLQLADEIKSLQSRWKALGAAAPEDVWERFQRAGDEAFKPCAAYSAAQQEIKNANLEIRHQLVGELKQLAEGLDDASTDWKKIRAGQQDIAARWKAASPVDPQRSRGTSKKYSKLMKAVHGRLEFVYAANQSAKEALIEAARQLREDAETQNKIPKLQALQKSWKQIGITDARRERKLWEAFRAAGDQVFEKHRAADKARQQSDKEAFAQVSAIIDELESLCAGENLDEPVIADVIVRIDAADFSSLSQASKLQQRYRKTLQQLDELRRERRKREKNKQWIELWRRAGLCSAVENAKAANKDAAVAALVEKWDEAPVTSEFLKPLEDRKAALLSGVSIDNAAAADRRRRLCVELELLLGVESPGENRALRMQMQMEQLQKTGLGAARNESTEGKKTALMLMFLGTPSAADEKSNLEDRFSKLCGIAAQ